jgi:hypothetical protein
VRQPQVLEKSHTQEEFIRGRMTRNPYSMKDIGQTMRDVKNKICVDLELAGLLEDDFSMELLVADKIVKLDLDINGVFEQVQNFRHLVYISTPPTLFLPRQQMAVRLSRHHALHNRRHCNVVARAVRDSRPFIVLKQLDKQLGQCVYWKTLALAAQVWTPYARQRERRRSGAQGMLGLMRGLRLVVCQGEELVDIVEFAGSS